MLDRRTIAAGAFVGIDIRIAVAEDVQSTEPVGCGAACGRVGVGPGDDGGGVGVGAGVLLAGGALVPPEGVLPPPPPPPPPPPLQAASVINTSAEKPGPAQCLRLTIIAALS